MASLAPLYHNSISSRDLEANLDLFLEEFWNSGHVEQFGAVLVKSVPSSKLRKYADHAFVARARLCISASQPSPLSTSVQGAWDLSYTHHSESTKWISTTERNQNGQTHITAADFMQMIENGDNLGPQCIELKSNFQGLRQALKISTFPVSAPDKAFRERCQALKATHLCGSIINISTKASPMSVNTPIFNLTIFHFLHSGSPRYWIIVPREEKTHLEDCVQQHFQSVIGQDNCSQWIHHGSIWISPTLLSEWGIKFYTVTQEIHQLFIVFPGSYTWGYSSGFSILESKFHAGNNWSLENYRPCDMDIQACISSPYSKGMLVDFISDARQVPSVGTGKRRASTALASPRLSQLSKTSATSAPSINPSTEPEENSIVVDPRSVPDGIHNTQYLQESTSFDMSDDDSHTDVHEARYGEILKLQQENVILRRNTIEAQVERDTAVVRKNEYKNRLLEREAFIKSLELQLVEAKRESWLEVERFARERYSSH